MNNETYIVFFGMLGIFLILLHRVKYACPPSRIEYRYIKRSFQQEQNNLAPVGEILTGMFDDPNKTNVQKNSNKETINPQQVALSLKYA